MKALSPTRIRPAPGQTGSRWLPALAAAAVWLLLAVSAGYWGLRWWGTSAPQAMPVLAAPERVIDPAQVARSLGARAATAASTPVAAAPGLDSRLRLLGVVAGRQGQGAALISVDGQPPKPHRIGSTVVDGLTLQSLGARHAELGGEAGRLRLELPATAGAGQP